MAKLQALFWEIPTHLARNTEDTPLLELVM
jgi:hypothetical protein